MALDQSVRTEVVKNILTFEKRIKHFYLDSVGKVTVGVGHMLPNKMAVSSIAMYKVVNKHTWCDGDVNRKAKRIRYHIKTKEKL